MMIINDIFILKREAFSCFDISLLVCFCVDSFVMFIYIVIFVCLFGLLFGLCFLFCLFIVRRLLYVVFFQFFLLTYFHFYFLNGGWGGNGSLLQMTCEGNIVLCNPLSASVWFFFLSCSGNNPFCFIQWSFGLMCNFTVLRMLNLCISRKHGI